MSDAKGRIYTFLLLREAGQADRVVIWDTQDITLGRAPENDLVVDHAEISRKHALFTREDEAWVVKDLGTSNGTRVNGEPIGVHPLKSKDVVRAGDLELHFARTRQNPAGLGIKLEYASQLKDFGPAQPANAESTMLGLVDSVSDPNEDSFHVAPAGDFDYDLAGMEAPPAAPAAPAAKDLDAELEGFGLDELDIDGPDVAPPESQDPWVLDEEMPDELSLPPADVEPASAAPASPASAEPTKNPGESDTAVPARKPEVPAQPEPVAAATPETLSLHVELSGLSPELQRVLRAIEGKQIDLPALSIRVKSDDLG